MVEIEFLEKLAGKSRTTIDNIFREYVQHLFLNYFYQQKSSEKVLFKGGTALRIVFTSPRYSEDLDFSAFDITCEELESLWENVFWNLAKEGLKVDILESKKTTGGCLAIFKTRLNELETEVHLEVSLRLERGIEGETVTVPGPFLPAFTVYTFPQKKLIAEKYKALLARSKPRDFFDLYFILRAGLALPEMKKNEVEKAIEQLDAGEIKRDLIRFLPKSMKPILKNFKENLKREVERVF